MNVLPRQLGWRVQRERLIAAHVALHRHKGADPDAYSIADQTFRAQEYRTPWWARVLAREIALVRYAREVGQTSGGRP